MALDATHRPLRIPTNFQNYAEEQNVHDLLGKMMEKVLISRPEDPLKFMVNFLRNDLNRTATVAIIGPPGSGKTTLSQSLKNHTNWKIQTNFEKTEIDEGIVLDGIPKNRAESIKLQEAGILVDYLFVLNGPKNLLEQRYTGSNFSAEFDEYIKNQQLIIDSHSIKRVHRINIDQPIKDVEDRILEIVRQAPVSDARFIVKSVLIGPTGSGKRTVAMKLAKKWDVIPVDMNILIKREILNKTRLGHELADSQGQYSSYLLARVLKSRLELQDCVERGWVIFGWPDNHIEKSIEALINEEFRPNRVLVLQINEESAVERLVNRLTDPETGIQYHTLYDPAAEENVRNRLVQRESDKKDAVISRIENYNQCLSKVLDDLADREPVFINADQDPDIVYQLVESKMSKPLKTKEFF